MTQHSTADGRSTPGAGELAGAPRRRLADYPFFADHMEPASPVTPATSATPGPPTARHSVEETMPDSRRDALAIDWPQVRALTRQASEEIQAQYGQRAATLTSTDRQMMAEPIIATVVADHAEQQTRDGNLWSQRDVRAYVKAITDSVFGMGRLQPLFEIPTAENVNVNGHDSVVVVHRDGRREELAPVADSNDELIDQLRHIGQNSSPKRPLDAAHPEMTVMVDGRFRLHAILNETSPVPSVSIRQHHLVAVSLADLAARGLMSMPVAEFLDAMVKANRTIVVGGEIGAGKTTLLRALLDAIPQNERYATLETDLELFAHRQPGRENNLVLHARSGMGETTQDGDRIGQISVADQIPWALRQDVRRIVIGEVLGPEAAAMFQAMQLGTGAMCTIHAKSSEAIAGRLAARVAQGRIYSHQEAMREVAANVDLLIHVSLLDDTWRHGGSRRRFISRIDYCSQGDDDMPTYHHIYTNGPEGERFIIPAELADLADRYRTDQMMYHQPLPRHSGDEGAAR